ncbi:DUF6941 family protein [Pseudomonas lactis]|uniref:DUF1833 domain-containing protein n=3 Tax=Pseudomonas TaxID=286 RepID=A0ABS9FNN8_9PSED|nr:hypothetical protein [Pseudomonas lactis]MBI6975106.1 hypothetical protein [Pseudomonas lactis]MCF4974164.1 hypothetical protein [Pseudomonas lactis]MCF5003920.1 hypothetical protein [Pseudomonas lactis]MCF5009217.1 hypothetical protein [Pseudomonas lactis]MCF5014680.1 hypothetical protein [Pseudomonas lactis]
MNRYAYSVFCDDIRQEINGKITMVGIYTNRLLVTSVPTVLPKLCLALSIATDKSSMFEEISVTGTFGADEVFKMELQKEQIEGIIAQSPDAESPAKFFTVQLNAILTPFQLQHTGKLSLKVLADGEELECAGLEMALAPPGTVIL